MVAGAEVWVIAMGNRGGIFSHLDSSPECLYVYCCKVSIPLGRRVFVVLHDFICFAPYIQKHKPHIL